MTTGQIIFYSGVGLLILTVVTAIVFLIKKPRYTPEHTAYEGVEEDTTQRLRNGYPTEQVTIRRETGPHEPGQGEQSTELLDETELLLPAENAKK